VDVAIPPVCCAQEGRGFCCPCDLCISAALGKVFASSREFDVILRAEIQWFAAILKDAEAKPQ
jgi:hypothetical protein